MYSKRTASAILCRHERDVKASQLSSSVLGTGDRVCAILCKVWAVGASTSPSPSPHGVVRTGQLTSFGRNKPSRRRRRLQAGKRRAGGVSCRALVGVRKPAPKRSRACHCSVASSCQLGPCRNISASFGARVVSFVSVTRFSPLAAHVLCPEPAWS